MMSNFDVTVNRWIGEGFQQPSITCAVCHKPGTVIEINGDRICGLCLDECHRKISEALLKSVWKPELEKNI
jgi:hypothetical protein